MPHTLAVSRLSPGTPIPDWASRGEFFSITRTSEELSVVCEERLVPSSVRSERNWRAFKVQGPIAFTTTGVLASLASPLAEKRVGLFVVSTFDTDYLLVKAPDFAQATQILRASGHEVRTP